MGVGEALDMPFRYLIVLREPGPRIFSFYQFIARTISHPTHAYLTAKKMTFGDFLEFSENDENHQLELNNGQSRRLSGMFSKKSLGKEPEILRIAQHKVLEPSVILGVVERIDNLLSRLVALGLLPSAELPTLNISPNPGAYTKAVQLLTDKQLRIFDEYTKHDSKLYQLAIENMDSEHAS